MLEGFDTWIWGIGITEDDLHVIDHAANVVRFDHDGSAVNAVDTGPTPLLRASGLWCHSPPS